MALNNGRRRTPIVDLGMGGEALEEPSNDTLTGGLVELAMLTRDEAYERLAVQNVGDIERAVRMSAGAALLASVRAMPRRGRWPVAVIGIFGVLTGLTGWCPAYHRTGVSSLNGPGDRPGEAEGNTWLVTAGTRV